MSLSEKVLSRKRDRRDKKIARCVALTALVLFVGLVGYSAWHEHHRNSPDWANWVQAGSGAPDAVNEHIREADPDSGVPFALYINGERWSVVLVDHFDDCSKNKAASCSIEAQTDCKHRTITYIASSDSRQLRENLMHEVFHAGACFHGGDSWWNSEHPDNVNHPGVYHLGEFTAMFLHDNPNFALWVSQ